VNAELKRTLWAATGKQRTKMDVARLHVDIAKLTAQWQLLQ